MANENKGNILNLIQKNLVGAIAIVVLVAMIVPTPKVIIDLLMVLNLALAITILLVVIYTPRASSFSSFPQIILFVTLFGLAINLSSTRLILSAQGTNLNALHNTQSAMVQAFANIVAGNSLVIGFVFFIILIVVQVAVITKGAGRVSEVAARFTLDSMSVKQFDIDSQLQQGNITPEEAERKKEELRKDIDFYSNMDGASKFVSGNVMAGIFITVVNLIGGFIVGMVFHNLSFQESLGLYTTLTIGDGLLSQLPSFMLSFATGILVTGDKSDDTLGDKIIKEFTIDGVIYVITGAVLILMGVVFRSGTQFLLVPVGVILVLYGYTLTKNKKIEEAKVAAAQADASNAPQTGQGSSAEADAVAPLDPLSLEIGFALIPLVDKDKGAELLERISRIRRESALDLGLPVPKIRIIDNMNLDPNEYCFKIRGIEAGRCKIRLGYYMCMNTGTVTEELKGEATRDPAFGMPAIWLPETQRSEAEQAGYVLVDSPTIIATHITEIIKAHAAEILGRKEVAVLVNEVKKDNPIVVDEVLNGDKRKFSYGEIEKILQGLLAEKVSIRNMVTILEAISNYGIITGNTWELIEKVREALGLQICMQYADSDRKLRVLQLSQDWSEKILEHAQYPSDGSRPYVAFDPVDGRAWIKSVSAAFGRVQALGYMPIIMCVSPVRQLVHSAIEREMPGVVVISDREMLSAVTSNGIGIEVLDEIKNEEGM
ncbi:MAG: flagellar biosynthesis protein FlhA [Treponema sp.]|nr:flagellar biosynthesis protein FlhA [Treponema sp.]